MAMKIKINFLVAITIILVFATGCSVQTNKKHSIENNFELKVYGQVILSKDDPEFDYRKELGVCLGDKRDNSQYEYLCNAKNTIKCNKIKWEDKDNQLVGTYEITLDKKNRNDYLLEYDCSCKFLDVKNKNAIKIDFDYSDIPQCAG